LSSFLLTTPPPPSSPLFPYTTLFRSIRSGSLRSGTDPGVDADEEADEGDGQEHQVVAEPARLDPPAPVPRDVDDPRDQVDHVVRSEEHTSELQSLTNLVCRLLLAKKT